MWKYVGITFLGLAACGPSIPDSGATPDGRPVDVGTGVGFGTYQSYESSRVARERELTGGFGTQQPVPTGAPFTAAAPVDPVISGDDLSAAGLPSGTSTGLPATQTIGAGAPLSAPSPAPVSSNNAGISDEQNFAAVSSRETIESDAQRLARQAQSYRVIQPTAVPTRSGAGAPNIVAYALSSTNQRGQQVFSRGGIAIGSRSVRACQKYPSPDLAQEAFLAAGGPDRDRLNLDPDGDGFACGWDPEPFRTARG